MENITYVTGNYGKYISVKEKFDKEGITINYFKYDLDEPNINDISVISREKARQAFSILETPVFVADTGFYIEDYPNNPNYPGAFVKRSGISTNIEELLKTMKDVQNRNCYFLDCLTFYDGKEYYQFYGSCHGTLSKDIRGDTIKRAKSNLWYVFIPNNCSKTLAEMTTEERNNRPDDRTSATDEFITWYKLNYKKGKKKSKSIACF